MESGSEVDRTVAYPMPFDFLVHADWSIAPGKRWVSVARLIGGRWQVVAPERVPPSESFVAQVVAPEAKSDRRLIGFDFPIRVPSKYGTRTGFHDFRELLLNVGTGAWSDFFNVAGLPEEISVRRPFYPMRSNNRPKRFHLFDKLEVKGIDELLRRCDRRTFVRNAACAMFWTLGAQQVGKAAICGWRDVIQPALERGARLWPFDGSLGDLARREGSIICETYPAEAYGHVGVRFGAAESKRRRTHRGAKAPAVFDWAKTHDVLLSEAASKAISDGFGRLSTGEDAFDSLIGLLGMIEVVSGRRREGPIDDSLIRLWEGWILGQSQ